VRLFLDSSVLIAAAASTEGASREIFRRASMRDWRLITTPGLWLLQDSKAGRKGAP